MLAIIGGSGLTTLSNLDVSHREVVRTPYGEPSGPVVFGQICGQPAMFLPRHGYGHTIPPHMVNYRANMWALHHHKATGVISVASVGGIRSDLQPGDIVLPHQIIDYTWGRKSTYFDGNGTPVTHVDFTEPYDAELCGRIRAAGEVLGIPMKSGGVYAATQGPRLETAAEINRLERDGADLVGMTGMPEAVLARELGLPYAAINVIANHAAGRGSSEHGIRFESLDEVLQGAMGRVRSVIEKLVGCQDICQR
ncbi:S-methyl-5'-thioinosine phosphorylase [Quatrionicoccus australiensis]|uniref:S-methyl-5'-thioinosine phosphorylase n=1 Tax=Quatrionicoccus australiensis TaxID=138118 RepID=UPI001CFAAA7C|nr:S-methyl-5'-thioinosine phosphorylase [Quatrionicoccus australiensis]MCB4358502.1 S-methyl-5'-thioinosine phosphorylase [Quatrionicoccus australiensis]